MKVVRPAFRAVLALALLAFASITPSFAQQAATRSGPGNKPVAMLAPVSTSSVDINTCDMDFIGGKSRPGSGGGSGGGGGSPSPGNGDPGSDPNLPPSPGPGFQPMTQHGQFVGWYSPEEVAMSSNGDFPGALVSILKSNRYYGGVLGAASILYELGLISSPFATDEAQAFLAH